MSHTAYDSLEMPFPLRREPSSYQMGMCTVPEGALLVFGQ